MTSTRFCRLCGSALRPEDRFCPGCGSNTQASSGDLPAAPVASRWDQLLERVRAAVAPRYSVHRVLGYGGMAGVYLGDEPRLARRVAIKVMAPELLLDQTLVHRFQQEAQTIAQLRHPNIVTVYNIDESDGLHYFVMEYVPGRTLAEVIAGEAQPIPFQAILHWLSQVGSALDYGHRQGVVHRDVKPGNVLLDADGNALVSDFGIAKASDRPGLTRTGMLVGTPAYVSPEYCLNGVAGGASDQYSLGIVAFELLTGRPPFTGATLATLQAHISQPPPSLTTLRADCPAALRAAVERMLAKRPEDRFPDIGSALLAMGAEPLPSDHPFRPELRTLSTAVERIELLPIPGPVPSGASMVMRARVLTDRGDEVERPISWSTSDPNVAVITRDGRVEARSPGSAVIIASVGDQSATAVLMVESPEVDGASPEAPEALSPEAVPVPRVIVPELFPTAPEAPEPPAPSSAGMAPVVAGEADEDAQEEIRADPAGEEPVAAVVEDGAGRKLPVRGRTAAAAAAVLVVAAAGTYWALGSAGAGGAPRADGAAPIGGAQAASSTLPATVTEPRPTDSLASRTTTPPIPGSGPGGAPALGGPVAATGAEKNTPEPATSAPTVGEIEIAGRLPAGSRVVLTGPDRRPRQVSGRSVQVAPGTYTVSVSADGYGATQTRLRVQAGDTARWAPVLVAEAATPERPPVSTPATTSATTSAGSGSSSAAPDSARPTPPPPPAAPDRSATAIRQTVGGFVRSLESRDVKQIERLYPDASSGWLKQWEPFLTNRHDVRDLRASITDAGEPDISGGTGRIRFTLLLEWNDLRNAPQRQQLDMTAVLAAENGNWVIRSLQGGK
ncbi:MAG TPA: protein kinase [Longimicrobiaceae bacterium]|nr:protein kinase [Longimicrobiaceae bacterium]